MPLGEGMNGRKHRLARLFPQAFKRGVLCWETLQQLLEEQEQEIEVPSISPLQEDTCIRSENRLALFALQENHKEYFDVVYIDPPYNTGRKFSYFDGRGEDWLEWMRNRLSLAYSLLTPKGVLFVSISDDEVHRLRFILEEIFGVENFIATFTWIKKKRGSHLSSTARTITEFVLCFAKHKKSVSLYGEAAYPVKAQPLLKRQNKVKSLFFAAGTLSTTLKDGVYEPPKHPLIHFDKKIIVKEGWVQNDQRLKGPFVWVQAKLDDEQKKGSRVVLSQRFGLNVHRHDQSTKFKPPFTLIDEDVGVGTYEDAFLELQRDCEEPFAFSYTKPISLIKYLLKMATHTNKEAKILDFFAGTGTTGLATWQLNQEDNGARKFCLVQQEEKNASARFPTIADITMHRLHKHKGDKKLCHLGYNASNWIHIKE